MSVCPKNVSKTGRVMTVNNCHNGQGDAWLTTVTTGRVVHERDNNDGQSDACTHRAVGGMPVYTGVVGKASIPR